MEKSVSQFDCIFYVKRLSSVFPNRICVSMCIHVLCVFFSAPFVLLLLSLLTAVIDEEEPFAIIANQMEKISIPISQSITHIHMYNSIFELVI